MSSRRFATCLFLLRSDLLPALTGRPPPECALFDLPARLCGLGIHLPSRYSDREYESSQIITAPLSGHILDQQDEYTYNGFTLHKAAFHDALALTYGWLPNNMPSTCDCGKQFSVDHALSCSKGGFPSIRHNEIRDITATLLTEVCHDVRLAACDN